jgi:hypothetical protein
MQNHSRKGEVQVSHKRTGAGAQVEDGRSSEQAGSKIRWYFGIETKETW